MLAELPMIVEFVITVGWVADEFVKNASAVVRRIAPDVAIANRHWRVCAIVDTATLAFVPAVAMLLSMATAERVVPPTGLPLKIPPPFALPPVPSAVFALMPPGHVECLSANLSYQNPAAIRPRCVVGDACVVQGYGSAKAVPNMRPPPCAAILAAVVAVIVLPVNVTLCLSANRLTPPPVAGAPVFCVELFEIVVFVSCTVPRKTFVLGTRSPLSMFIAPP